MAKSIDQNFADWEGHIFGLGYGTGEPHVLPALREFLTLCNRSPNGLYDYEVLEEQLTPVVAWLLINALGRADMIEYGTSPRYGWLTAKGCALKKFVLSCDEADLIRLACEREDACYPDACNCDGYVEGKVCVNPFWQDAAARAYLQDSPDKTIGNDDV